MLKPSRTPNPTTTPLKLFVCLAILFAAGCAVEEAHWDEARLREHAIAYYADQTIDNLIRAKNGQFFLHVNINSLTAQVISEVAGTVGGGNTSTDMHNRQVTNQTTTTTTSNGPTGSTQTTVGGPSNGQVVTTAGAAAVNQAVAVVGGTVGTLSRMAMSPFSYSVTPKRNDQLNMGAVPEVNDSDLYKAYLQFLNVDDQHTSLSSIGTNYKLLIGDEVKSVLKTKPGDKMIAGLPDPSKPKPKNAVYFVPGTLKRWNGDEYYVPIKFWSAYFQLCVEISGRINLPKKGAAAGGAPTAAAEPGRDPHFLPPKPESPAEKELRLLQQKIDSLPKQP